LDSGPFLAADYVAGRVCRVTKEGAIDWEFPAPNSCDVWSLPNGNVLFSTRDGAKEVTSEKKIVWEYKTAKGNEVYTCQRLPNGDTLVGELGACRLIEVGADGAIHKAVPVPVKGRTHLQFRNARKLDNGHYLVACTAEHAVKELDADGNAVWQFAAPGDPFCAVRLASGNTLVACGDGHTLVEADAAGKIVWQIGENELPGITLRFVAGVQRLPSGNTVVCNWLGHGHIGDGVHLFEITPEKKVLWQFADHKSFKTISSVQMLGVSGDVTKNEIYK
jgi:hypothetical protein